MSRQAEIDLLLSAVRVDGGRAQGERTRALLRQPLDWPLVLRAGGLHGVLPVLHRHLSTTCPEVVPAAVRDRLAAHYQRNARRNLFLTGELLGLLDLLQAHGIPALPYKGPALAVFVHANRALREFMDLDIVVHRRDALKAKDLLLTRGYQPHERLTPVEEKAYFDSHPEWGFQRADGLVQVEVAWHIAPRCLSFRLDGERLWERLETMTLGRREVWTLPPEELLVILCMHGGKHRWERLNWLHDVARLTQIPRGLDWPRVLAEARHAGGERMLLVGLFLARDLLGADLPAEVVRAMQSQPAARAVARAAAEYLAREPDGRPLGTWKLMQFHLRLLEPLRKKLAYCFDVLGTPTVPDWHAVALPPSLHFLYYLARPIRLTGKYGAALLRLPRRVRA